MDAGQVSQVHKIRRKDCGYRKYQTKIYKCKDCPAVKRDRYVPDRSIVLLAWKTGENYFFECAKSYRFRPDLTIP